MLPGLSSAEEATYAIPQPAKSSQDKILPAVTEKFVQNMEEALGIKNIAEIFNQDSIFVKYDREGRIEEVYLKDGRTITYSYEYDDEGNLSSVKLTSGSLTLDFRAPGYKPGKPDTPGPDTPGPDTTGSGKGSDDKPIIIIVPPSLLEQIAHTPIDFDFDKIKDGFNKASKEKGKAYEEYMKKTAPYYENVLNELHAGAAAMEAEGVKSAVFVKDINPDGSIDAEQRERVDEAVQDIRRRAEERRGAAMQAERFLAVEKIYADVFLGPNRAIYEDKIKKAMDYVNAIIDTVIKSNLAVYLNIKKDKIEAIVNLPEIKK